MPARKITSENYVTKPTLIVVYNWSKINEVQQLGIDFPIEKVNRFSLTGVWKVKYKDPITLKQ